MCNASYSNAIFILTGKASGLARGSRRSPTHPGRRPAAALAGKWSGARDLEGYLWSLPAAYSHGAGRRERGWQDHPAGRPSGPQDKCVPFQELKSHVHTYQHIQTYWLVTKGFFESMAVSELQQSHGIGGHK